MKQTTSAPPVSQSDPPIRKSRRLRRWLIAILLLFMSVFAAAFVFRSALVSLLAPAFLTRAGLQEVSLQMGNIGSSHVEIDFATGILPLPAGDIRVQLEGVAYDFNYRQLLAGKVERFKVAKAELNLPNWEKKPVPDQNDAKEQGDFSLEQL